MTNTVFKEKLYNLVHNSSLTTDEITLWDLFMHISHPDEDEAVYDAITQEKDEKNLKLLTQHLRDKIFSMKPENKQLWEKVLAEEERFANLFNQ